MVFDLYSSPIYPYSELQRSPDLNTSTVPVVPILGVRLTWIELLRNVFLNGPLILNVKSPFSAFITRVQLSQSARTLKLFPLAHDRVNIIDIIKKIRMIIMFILQNDIPKFT